MIRTKVAGIRETSRNAQGVKIMTLEESERVVCIERIAERAEDDDNGNDVDEATSGSEAPPAVADSGFTTSAPPPSGGGEHEPIG
jgi:DNA gyrase subunit A